VLNTAESPTDVHIIISVFQSPERSNTSLYLPVQWVTWDGISPYETCAFLVYWPTVYP